MPNVAAVSAKAARSVPIPAPVSDRKLTRMKNRPCGRSSNCAESVMLQPWRARNEATAATMPRCVGQATVSTISPGASPTGSAGAPPACSPMVAKTSDLPFGHLHDQPVERRRDLDLAGQP